MPTTVVILEKMAENLFYAPTFEQFRAIQQGGSWHTGLIELIVPALHRTAIILQLPAERRPAVLNWDDIGAMAAVLAAKEVGDALEEHMQAEMGHARQVVSSSTLRLLCMACLLVVHAPLHATDLQPELLTKLMQLLGRVCQHAFCALHGFSANDLLGRQQMAQLSRLAEQLLQALPRLPQMLQLLAADEEQQFGLDSVVVVCDGWEEAACLMEKLLELSIPEGLGSSAAAANSAADLPAWCRAGSAAIRALPPLAAIAQQLQGLSLYRLQSLLARLFEFSVSLSAGLQSCGRQFGASPPTD